MAGKLSGPFWTVLGWVEFPPGQPRRLTSLGPAGLHLKIGNYTAYIYTHALYSSHTYTVWLRVYISIYKCRYISCRDFFSRCLEFWREWILTSFVKSDLGQFQQLKVSNLDLSIVTSGTRAAL